MPTLEPFLKELANNGKISLRNSKVTDIGGNVNVIKCLETDELFLGEQKSSEMKDTVLTPGTVKLAYYKNKKIRDFPQDAKDEITVANRAQQLLVGRGVDRQFIQPLIAFNDAGEKFALWATEGSLMEVEKIKNIFLKKHQRNPEMVIKEVVSLIKNLFAQTALAASALHEKNIAHRDLRAPNVLLTKFNNRLIVQLADVDTAVPVNPKDGTMEDDINYVSLIGSMMSPELTSLRFGGTNPDKQKIYKNINLKADDCFELGGILYHLIENTALDQLITEIEEANVLDPQKLDVYKKWLAQFEDLADKLQHRDPAQRFTIAEVLEHPMFGESKEVRQQFFKELREFCQLPGFINGYPLLASEPNNDFLLMKANLQPIYYLAKELDKQFDYVDSMLKNTAFSQEDLTLRFNQMENQFKELKKNIELPHDAQTQGIVDKLNEQVIQIFQQLESGYLNKMWENLPAEQKIKRVGAMPHEQLFNILSSQNNLENEFKSAIGSLEMTIKNSNAHAVANIFLEKLQVEGKKKMDPKNLLLLTELVFRTIEAIKNPDNQPNFSRCSLLAKKLQETSASEMHKPPYYQIGSSAEVLLTKLAAVENRASVYKQR